MHAYMFAFPAWKEFREMTDAVEFVFDQCTALDDPARAVTTGRKATAILVSGNAAPFAETIFRNKRCRHPKGTHRPIRGTDDNGVYLTAGTEVYSSRLCEWIAQHTRHIDRKLFKLREMRGAGLVTVKYLGTEENTADIFTKILDRQPFEKHRKTVLNAAANDGVPSARDKKAMGAWPRRF